MHQDIKSLDVPSISSAQNELKDLARLEDAAQSSPSDTLSCLEMVLQGAPVCLYSSLSSASPDKVMQVVKFRFQLQDE